MSNIMELIDAYADLQSEVDYLQDQGTTNQMATIYPKTERKCTEARAAVVEAVEKLERDAAMISRVIVMHPDDPAIKHLDRVLVYVQRTLPKMEATNGQDH